MGLFTIAKIWRQLKLFIDRATDKEDVICTYNGILLTHKKNIICNNMNRPWIGLQIIILSEVYHTKSDIERQISYGIAYMWDLEK